MAGNPNPNSPKAQKPPRRHWKASEPFFDLKFSHWIEIFLTAALIGVAWFQVRIYTQQAEIMSTQATIMDDTLKQTRIATDAAKDQATAAQSQARTAIDEQRRAHRPWLDFAGMPNIVEPLTFQGGGAAYVSVNASAKNAGNSPAIGVFLSIALNGEKLNGIGLPKEIGEARKLMMCDPKEVITMGALAGILILPGDTAPLRTSKSVTDYKSITNEIGIVWITICLGYQDEFGLPHGTSRLMFYVPDGKRQNVPNVGQVINGHLQQFIASTAY